jgi:UDP-2,3-diacylglucosamine hydrolase
MIKTEINLRLPGNKKIYFTSDWHLGYPGYQSGLKREKIILEWLRSIEKDAYAVFLVGDIFDFWFEYKYAVPQNFVRVLGQLAEMADKGIKLYYFYGNHDMWFRNYLAREIGVQFIPDYAEAKIDDKVFFVAHGDGLGPGDNKFKLIKKVFRNPVAQWFFRWLHPDLGIPLASYFSRKSRAHQPAEADQFLGADKEHLILFSKEKLKEKHYDYFVFGHRHHFIEYDLTEKSKYINLGDWIKHFSYGVWDGKDFSLLQYQNPPDL